jgi:hypothetical protein
MLPLAFAMSKARSNPHRPESADEGENAVKVEPVGEFELKGIRRPLAAYNVLGTASQQA